MTDYLQTGPWKTLAKTFNIPLPIPSILEREEIDTPIKEDEFWGRKIKIGCAPNAEKIKLAITTELDQRGIDFVRVCAIEY